MIFEVTVTKVILLNTRNLNIFFSAYISNHENFHADSLCLNLSYMGTMKIQVMGPKAYIYEKMLLKCFMEAFEEIKEASIHRES